jgi:hypothetical protein
VRGTERCTTRHEPKGKPQKQNISTTRTLHRLDAVSRIIEFARGLPFSNAAKELSFTRQREGQTRHRHLRGLAAAGD